MIQITVLVNKDISMKLIMKFASPAIIHVQLAQTQAHVTLVLRVFRSLENRVCASKNNLILISNKVQKQLPKIKSTCSLI